MGEHVADIDKWMTQMQFIEVDDGDSCVRDQGLVVVEVAVCCAKRFCLPGQPVGDPFTQPGQASGKRGEQQREPARGLHDRRRLVGQCSRRQAGNLDRLEPGETVGHGIHPLLIGGRSAKRRQLGSAGVLMGDQPQIGCVRQDTRRGDVRLPEGPGRRDQPLPPVVFEDLGIEAIVIAASHVKQEQGLAARLVPQEAWAVRVHRARLGWQGR